MTQDEPQTLKPTVHEIDRLRQRYGEHTPRLVLPAQTARPTPTLAATPAATPTPPPAAAPPAASEQWSTGSPPWDVGAPLYSGVDAAARASRTEPPAADPVADDLKLLDRFAGIASANGAHISTLSNDLKLRFYGLYKQATSGECAGKRPGAFDVTKRAKYDAWASVTKRGLSRADARREYVELLAQHGGSV